MSKKLNRHFIIVCGADHSGKSKLSEHLIEKYRFNYYHCGVHPDIKAFHSDVLDLAFNDIIKYDSNFIIDRLHLSEEIYGNIFRNGPQYDWKELNLKIESHSNDNNIKYTLIICLPPRETVIAGHAKRNADGNEMFDTVDEVYDAYVKLYDTNKDTINFYRYDYTEDGNYTKLDEYLENK